MKHWTSVIALAGIGRALGGITANGPPVVVKGRPATAMILPSLSDIRYEQVRAVESSPTSNIQGYAFDRIVQIWLENTNYDAAFADSNFKWFLDKGILLTNFFAVTHPSQPNYAASAAGEHFGLDSGDMIRFPENVSTVADLLDTRGISWGAYQEGMPYAGYQGFNFSNQENFRNDYMRKHNPMIIFDGVANNATRSSRVKNFTSFERELKREGLPQWMFITPNMTNDGHDTNYRFAAKWARSFLEPLLKNDYFMRRTLVLLTFDEDEVYAVPNRVFTVLLGGAIPSDLRGSTDATFYTHYSTLASVEANWDLPSLGRWDCGANIFDFVSAKKSAATSSPGHTNVMPAGVVGWPEGASQLVMGESYPGPLSNAKYTPGWWPVPDTTSQCSAGNGVLPAVKAAWGGLGTRSFNYTDPWPYDVRSGSNTNAVLELGAGKAIPGDGASSSATAGQQNRVSLAGRVAGGRPAAAAWGSSFASVLMVRAFPSSWWS